MKHLWEIDHSYYCSPDNYFSNECSESYRSWADFIETEGDSDFDMNLIFRFDWQEGKEHDLPEFSGDENYRNGRLQLFIIGQRKGLFRHVAVDVCRADEPAVIKWLKPRYEHLKEMWLPIAV